MNPLLLLVLIAAGAGLASRARRPPPAARPPAQPASQPTQPPAQAAPAHTRPAHRGQAHHTADPFAGMNFEPDTSTTPQPEWLVNSANRYGNRFAETFLGAVPLLGPLLKVGYEQAVKHPLANPNGNNGGPQVTAPPGPSGPPDVSGYPADQRAHQLIERTPVDNIDQHAQQPPPPPKPTPVTATKKHAERFFNNPGIPKMTYNPTTHQFEDN